MIFVQIEDVKKADRIPSGGSKSGHQWRFQHNFTLRIYFRQLCTYQLHRSSDLGSCDLFEL